MSGFASIALTPVVLLASGLLIIRFRKLSWREDVGFRAPRLVDVILWCAIFMLVDLTAEALATGDPDGSWRGKYSGADLAIRLVAVPLVYPIVEEFFFRGVFFGVVRRRAGNLAAILAPALVFALIHVQYDWRGMAFVMLSGVLYGLARLHSRSVWVPMLLHVLNNSLAVWERLSPAAP